jgi:hypothetical protein
MVVGRQPCCLILDMRLNQEGHQLELLRGVDHCDAFDVDAAPRIIDGDNDLAFVRQDNVFVRIVEPNGLATFSDRLAIERSVRIIEDRAKQATSRQCLVNKCLAILANSVGENVPRGRTGFGSS